MTSILFPSCYDAVFVGLPMGTSHVHGCSQGTSIYVAFGLTNHIRGFFFAIIMSFRYILNDMDPHIQNVYMSSLEEYPVVMK